MACLFDSTVGGSSPAQAAEILIRVNIADKMIRFTFYFLLDLKIKTYIQAILIMIGVRAKRVPKISFAVDN
jgi:hypothetical protein